MGKIKTLKQLEDFQDSLVKKRDPNKLCITVCGGTGCRAYAWEELIRAFEAEIEKQGLKEKIDIRITGCHGFASEDLWW